ncbi:MAG TPA: xanthine dehydrogenase family protein molybdopterin-binding subunit, partial [Geminicoccaceae bacterium]
MTRLEDERLLVGGGCYTDDVRPATQAAAVFVRSPHAHAEVRSVDTAAAHVMPGVLAVLTVADLDAAGLGPLPCRTPYRNRDGSPMPLPPRPALAGGRVRHVGEPVACVVAETPAQARDA